MGYGERTIKILALIHIDVYGPFDVQTWGSYGYVYLMGHKFEIFERFKEFRYEVNKQTKKLLKVFRSDREGEYLSGEFRNYLKQNGIVS